MVRGPALFMVPGEECWARTEHGILCVRHAWYSSDLYGFQGLLHALAMVVGTTESIVD